MSTWREQAACNDSTVDPEWFFPEAPGMAGNRAKAICNGCGVRDECLSAALWEPLRGIWGGTTESQRVAMRRDMGMALPSGWTARRRLSSWEERYHELRDLGYSDFDVLRKLGIKPQSLMRQLHRYGITPSRELVELVTESKAVS